MARHPAPNPAASGPAASRSADCIIDFDAPDLAGQIEKLRPADRDRLPFGVIEFDRVGQVLIYNATEAKLSGYGTTPLGQNFFEVARSANKADLELRVMRAMEEGPVDFELGWLGGYGARELGADESEARFDAALKTVARHKPSKRQEKSSTK